jgi:hypothetical protein
MSLIKGWIQQPSRIEIHMPFESIPNERRNQVTLGINTALALLTSVTNSEHTYDLMVSLNCQFVNDLMSLPTINKYFIPLLDGEGEKISIKNMYQAYYYSKKEEMACSQD